MKSSKLFLLLIGIISISFGLGSLAFAQQNNLSLTTQQPPTKLSSAVSTLSEQQQQPPENNNNNSGGSGVTPDLSIGGIAAVAAGGVINSIYSKRNSEKTHKYGEEAIETLVNDNADNYNDFVEYLNIEKGIMDDAAKPENKTKSYNELLDIVVDLSTGETWRKKKGNYINAARQWSTSYYKNPTNSISCPDSKNPMARALTYVKRHTTEA